MKLLTPAPIGSYLIRASQRNVGDYSISFRVAASIKHFKVHTEDGERERREGERERREMRETYRQRERGREAERKRKRAERTPQRRLPQSRTQREETDLRQSTDMCRLYHSFPVFFLPSKIISHEYGDYFIADNSFPSLGDVVEFYCNHYLCDNMCLEHPVKPLREQVSQLRYRRFRFRERY